MLMLTFGQILSLFQPSSPLCKLHQLLQEDGVWPSVSESMKGSLMLLMPKCSALSILITANHASPLTRGKHASVVVAPPSQDLWQAQDCR